MRAVVRTRYGPPEVLRLAEVPTPVPKSSEVLMDQILATGKVLTTRQPSAHSC